MTIRNPYPKAATLRLGAPQWVVDLLLLISALSGVVCLLFLPTAVDMSAQYRHGATLITVMAAIVGFMVLMCVRAIFQRSPNSLTFARTVATMICLTVVFLPLGAAILVGLKRAQPAVWEYEPAHRRVALLLVIPLLAWIAFDLQFATDGRGTFLVPATSLVTAIILSGTVGVLLRRAWARPIAALAALLAALTGAGLVFALPALAVLWSRASRIPRDVPDVADLHEQPRAAATYRPYPLFTAATVLICVAAYIAELPGSSIGFVLIGVAPPPPVVTLGAVNGPAIAHGEVWRLVTAGYLHGGLLHLLLNMVALIVAGRYAERRYGPARSAVVYFGALVGGNLLAAALSSPASYTLGASGAIMGLFGAMVVAGTRFRSEGDSLVWSAGLVLATLVYGFLHSGVSNSAHAGGLLIGFCLAAGIGTHPAWTSQVRRLEWSRRVESESERAEALHHRPLPSAIAEPSNRIVLCMSAGQRVRRWALATVFPIAFVGDLVYLLTLGRPPTSAELGFAGLATMMALPSIVVALTTFGHLELRPDGFRQVTPLLPAPLVPWLDVEGKFFTSEVGYQKFVGYYLTPAAQARVTGLRSLVPGATQRVMVYGMTADQQAELMEEWWRRWAGMRSAI